MKKNLDKAQAEAIVNNYKETIKKGLPSTNSEGKEITDQTKWVWFPKEQIEKVLREFYSSSILETEQGIKFYLGAYGKDPVRGDEDMKDYTGMITLLMVPSFKDVSGGIVDLATVSTKGPGLIENLGTMCPPECGGVSDDEL